MKSLKTLIAVLSFVSTSAMALDLENVSPSSYEVDGKCYCNPDTDFENGLNDILVSTPAGELTPAMICDDIFTVFGEGAVDNRVPYNDIQCGNGPASNAADEASCPGRLDMGDEGCSFVGPKWDLVGVYGTLPEQPDEDSGAEFPSVRFENPLNLSTIASASGPLVEVFAEDNDGINSVSLFLDGAFVRSINQAPFIWNDKETSDPELRNLAPGFYSLSAVAIDNIGLVSEADIVITIVEDDKPVFDDNQAPEVEFASLRDGDTFRRGSKPLIVVNAEDDDGISSVKLFLNDQFVREEFYAPYRWNGHRSGDRLLKGLQPGTYTLRAVAEDVLGLSSESTIRFTISEKGHGKKAGKNKRGNKHYDRKKSSKKRR